MVTLSTLPDVTRLCKRDVTRENVTVRNVGRMEDESWKDCGEAWERIKWARERKFETAEEAAEGIPMKPGTYRAYERSKATSKGTYLSEERAEQFAKRFGVRAEWLRKGTGSPYVDEHLRIMARIAEVIGGETDIEKLEAVVDLVEALVKSPIPPRSRAKG